MADVSRKNAASTTKIVGSTTAGVETNYVEADSNNNLNTALYGGTDNTKIGNVGDKLKVAVDSALTVLLGKSQVYDFIHASNWMAQASYNDVQISVLGSVTTLTYKEDSSELGVAVVDFTDSDTWSIAMERYLDDDDGTILLDDDGTNLNLD